jgi:hypothetical protein
VQPTLTTVVAFALLLGSSLSFGAEPVPARETATIHRVRVTGSNRDLRVEITADEPITPCIQTATGPERLIIDFPQALPSPNLHKVLVNRGNLRDVRVGLFSASPQVTRVVLDLNARSQYRVLPSGNTIVVRLVDVAPASPLSSNKTASNTPRDRTHAMTASVAGKPHQDRFRRIRGNWYRSPALRGVRVSESDEDVEVEITADQPVAPLTQVVENPNRLVVDFPGFVPSRELQDLPVNCAELRGIRVGLFMSKPPVARVVLDLNAQPKFDLLSSGQHVIVRLTGKTQAEIIGTVTGGVVRRLPAPAPPAATSRAVFGDPRRLRVSFRAGKLGIWADGATLSDVLSEIQRQSGADIPIPSGARNERVAVDLGPGPISDVLANLLNGSPFNFVIVGAPGDPSHVSSVQLTQRDSKQPPSPSSPPSATASPAPQPATEPFHQSVPLPETLPVPPPPLPEAPPVSLPPTPDTPPQSPQT